MPRRDPRTDPRPTDAIHYVEDGKRKVVEVVSIDDLGILVYREDGTERMTTLTVWRILAAKGWRSAK